MSSARRRAALATALAAALAAALTHRAPYHATAEQLGSRARAEEDAALQDERHAGVESLAWQQRLGRPKAQQQLHAAEPARPRRCRRPQRGVGGALNLGARRLTASGGGIGRA